MKAVQTKRDLFAEFPAGEYDLFARSANDLAWFKSYFDRCGLEPDLLSRAQG